MTDTERALLRAVREEPDADEHRLVYADFLDENGQGERAEFIRRSIALDVQGFNDGPCTPNENECLCSGEGPALRKLVEKHGDEWANAKDIHQSITLVWKRGFVDTITLTMSQFMGGPCGTCDGRGTLYGDYGNITSSEPGPCPHCKAGQTPGLARELFERWPITGVRLSDREPQPNSYGGTVVAWHSDPNEAWMQSWIPYGLLRVMAAIVDEDGDLDGRTWLTFPTPQASHAALSDAAVAYCRGLVGLRALPRPE